MHMSVQTVLVDIVQVGGIHIVVFRVIMSGIMIFLQKVVEIFV